MRIYIGFDDTDTLDSDCGTGKLARWFENELPEPYRLWGVVRQQLLLDPSIPYTTHNSQVIHQIQIINGLEEGNITKALNGETIGTTIYKE